MPRPTKGQRTPGSGKPKGYKAPQTLEKLAAREYVRQKVTNAIDALVDAQIANAQGVRHFVLRDKHGKFEKVTSEEAALAALNDPGSVYEFWTRDPSIQAFTDLMNRALDKPKDQPQEVEVKGTLSLEHLVAGLTDDHDGS